MAEAFMARNYRGLGIVRQNEAFTAEVREDQACGLTTTWVRQRILLALAPGIPCPSLNLEEGYETDPPRLLPPDPRWCAFAGAKRSSAPDSSQREAGQQGVHSNGKWNGIFLRRSGQME